MLARWVLALGVTAVISSVACAGTSSGPVLTIDAITAATTETDSARMSMEMTLASPPAGEVRLTLEGVTTLAVDLDDITADMTGEVEVPGAAGHGATGAMRIVEGRIFVKGFFAQSMGLPSSDRWAEVPEDKHDAMSQLGAGAADPTDPTAALSVLQAATGLERVGPDTVRGVDTVHLTATTTFDEILEAQGLDMEEHLRSQEELTGQVPEGMARRLIEVMRDLQVELDVWVDDESRLRRTRLATDMAPVYRAALEGGDVPSAPEVDEAPMTVTFELHDFGVPVDVAVPTDAG